MEHYCTSQLASECECDTVIITTVRHHLNCTNDFGNIVSPGVNQRSLWQTLVRGVAPEQDQLMAQLMSASFLRTGNQPLVQSTFFSPAVNVLPPFTNKDTERLSQTCRVFFF